MRTTLVSVDLDDISCYHAIHGIDGPPPRAHGVVLERCLPRFLELFAAVGIRATFFVIGRDLDRDLRAGGVGASHLRQALAEGHELANHSHAHAYDLVRWNSQAQRSDLRACDILLRELGADVTGFRAPGYTHDRRLLQQVAALGYTYDSSALPSPPYYAAKLGVIASMLAIGRRSRSMVRGARTFLGPRTPYRDRASGLCELPMSVTPRLRIPLIGTSMLSGSEFVARRLAERAASLDYFHLELHGIDLSEAGDGYAPALLRRQPELKVPLHVKRDRLRSLLVERGPTTLLRDMPRRV